MDFLFLVIELTLNNKDECSSEKHRFKSITYDKNEHHLQLHSLAAAAAKSLQSCPTLCDPMDCSPPDPSVHGILQVRILEWVAIFFFRGSSQPRDQTQVSHIAGRLYRLSHQCGINTSENSFFTEALPVRIYKCLHEDFSNSNLGNNWIRINLWDNFLNGDFWIPPQILSRNSEERKHNSAWFPHDSWLFKSLRTLILTFIQSFIKCCLSQNYRWIVLKIFKGCSHTLSMGCWFCACRTQGYRGLTIFANHIIGNRLMSRIYRELVQPSGNESEQPN